MSDSVLSIDFPVIDISCIILPYDISLVSIDISGGLFPLENWILPIDISGNSEIWYSLDISFISMDVSYALENSRMVLFSHESILNENDK